MAEGRKIEGMIRGRDGLGSLGSSFMDGFCTTTLYK